MKTLLGALTTLFLMTPLTFSNLLAPFSGTLLYRHIEYPNGIDEDRYYLQETEQRLLFNQTPIVHTGPIHGLGTLLVNQSILVDTFYIPEAAREYSYELLLPPEELRIIVFIVNLCGMTVTNTTDFYKTLIFSNQQRYNLADYYTSCSLGKYALSPDSIVFTPVRVPCTNFTNACNDRDFVGWALYAEDRAKEQGIKLESFQYRTFIIPYGTTCSWLGLADVGCPRWCRSWVKGGVEGFSIMALFHELGHNHGLRHAGSPPDNEYGDYTAAMGGCCGLRCHNAAQGYALGWYAPLPFKNQSGFFELPALLTHPNNHLRLNSYYISFRGRQGYDATLTATNQIHIHNFSGTPTNRYFRSQLLATLDVNQTYTQKDANWSVRFVNHTLTRALVYITYLHTPNCGSCGDGVCDPSAGETCYNCPIDCRERTTRLGVYFCCGVTHTCHYFRCNTTRYICNYHCGPSPPETIRKIIL